MKSAILIFLLGICINIFSQTNVLDNYIKLGLENNLAIQQKQASYEKSIAVLKEARGLFFPHIQINARYSLAEGGRTIEFPVRQLFQGYTDYNNFIKGINP